RQRRPNRPSSEGTTKVTNKKGRIRGQFLPNYIALRSIFSPYERETRNAVFSYDFPCSGEVRQSRAASV
ncbi:hypothetical protein, partial [Mesorhizobium sp. M2A.F.Ca.ET.039.01.1.1]|uniref:hypothetical protein n=1 Tax=Mesorhizobium sp. M2A.F.Ca.ET.039.01.1.1 TaxID=2496746 RepID=UPI001AECD144